MVKQSNSDTEQTNPIETLTYTVGQSQLPETPFLDLIYSEPGAKLFLGHTGEEFLLTADVEGKVTHNRLKHFDKIFLATVLGLMERGLDHISAWVPLDKLNFARFFGFEELNSVRIIQGLEGETLKLREMIFIFPEVGNDQTIA